ncbi:MAG TPA: hypothetical protein VFE19_04060 [Jatrophihabitantaceae bacterium]|nr:hypothetical protein [Jatrophihabitantaceae bacterium]
MLDPMSDVVQPLDQVLAPVAQVPIAVVRVTVVVAGSERVAVLGCDGPVTVGVASAVIARAPGRPMVRAMRVAVGLELRRRMLFIMTGVMATTVPPRMAMRGRRPRKQRSCHAEEHRCEGSCGNPAQHQLTLANICFHTSIGHFRYIHISSSSHHFPDEPSATPKTGPCDGLQLSPHSVRVAEWQTR